MYPPNFESMTAIGLYVGCCITVFGAAALAAAGGVGGGGIMTPILLLFLQYSFSDCVPLSLCITSGNALAQFFLNYALRSPYNDRRPMIWWELVVLLLPAQLAGANIGSLLENILPSSVLYIVAVLVLLFASKVCFDKALAKRRLEQEHINPSIVIDDYIDNPIPHRSSLEISHTPITSLSDPLIKEPELEPINWPVMVFIALACMWVCYVCLSVGISQVDRCSKAYIALFVLIYIPLTCCLLWSIQYNQRKMQSYSVSDNDPNSLQNIEKKMMRDDLYVLPLYLFLIGIICSLLGIGGGELISPLLLSYHVSPVVVSATASAMGLLTAVSNVARDAAEGEINYGTGALLFLMGLLGGLVGRKFGLYMTMRNKSSVIVFALCCALCLSAVYYVYKLAGTKFDSDLSDLCDS